MTNHEGPYMFFMRCSSLLLSALFLCACSFDNRSVTVGSASIKLPEGTAEGTSPSACGSNSSAGGRVYRVQIPSTIDEQPIVFQVFEPDVIDCSAKHALVLEGHGYAGSRQTAKSSGPLMGAPIGPYTAAGFAVISIDQRGHGESGGTIRVMDPAFEGRDLATVLDWAEQHLDYLRYRDGNLLVGSIGGSYGGGYQMLLWETDPKARLDAMVPTITWNDLAYSLSPGDVAKSFWLAFLGSGGDINTRGRQDPYLRAALLNAAATGRMPEEAKKQFFAHSPAYFCGQDYYSYGDLKGTKSDGADFATSSLTSSLPITSGLFEVTKSPLRSFNKVDALLFQGNRDNLFNINEAYHNFQCLKKGGGDVRLLTVENGHGTVTPDLGLIYEALAVKGVPISENCGPVNGTEATIAWFNEKLLGKGRADDVIRSGKKICLSLQTNDAVLLDQMPVGGKEFPVELPGGIPVAVTLGQLIPTVVPLASVTEISEVVGGIPRLSVNVASGLPGIDTLCQKSTDPFLRLATCDATVFVGLGIMTLSTSGKPPLVPELIDNQVMPLRGLGDHEVDLVGIGERLHKGDQLVLLVYGTAPIFAGTSSRDPLSAVVTLKGKVSVPLLGDLPNFK